MSWAEIFSISKQRAEISSFRRRWGVHAALQKQIASDSTKRKRCGRDRYSRVQSKQDFGAPGAFMWIILGGTKMKRHFAMLGQDGHGFCNDEGLRKYISALGEL